ncbi:M23 family metallopeptidase [Croceicoccus bisphenolivorans]|uniref:M23 family metallopeptidase n=1 Tax=Croceicoccus bisphenolivorans TaxID=1783232 RepID=UPI00083497B0|nr:M23 family metallopeptidase [Croceicoccus bisphenolivorans]
MTASTASSKPAIAASRRGGLGRDLRLVLTVAGFTSLAWIGIIAFAGPDLFAPERPDGETVATNGQREEAAFVVPAPPVDDGLTVPVSGNLIIPVDGVRYGELVDTYNEPRGEERHEALDIIAPDGTPVLAAASGTVEKLFLSDDGGKTIYVRSPDGSRIYYYAHLSVYAPGLAEGQFVEAGRRIGRVGSSGNADPATPHLHFAVMRMIPDEPWWEGTPINPYPLLAAQTGE